MVGKLNKLYRAFIDYRKVTGPDSDLKRDRKNYKSFVDRETGKTYKYSPKSNEFIIVDKRGYIVTYYKPTSGYDYYKRQYAKYVKK